MAHIPIYTRSPRMIQVSGTNGQDTKVELYIFNSPDLPPSSPSYTLTKPIPSTLITECVYNISPFIKRFISHSSFIEPAAPIAIPVNEYCYCYVKVYLDGVLQGSGSYTYEFICFNGYGYNIDGYNPAPPYSLMTEGTYYTEENNGYGGLQVFNPLDGTTFEVKYTSLVSGLSTTLPLSLEVSKMPNVYPSYLSEGNKVEVLRDSVAQSTYYFKPICEHKYTALKCDFVNRSGAWQRLVFFKASKEEFKMTNKEFNLMPENVDYDLDANVRQVFNVNGEKSITVNTGWVNDDYSEVIKELLLSEKIILNSKPVILKTKGIELQESINKNNINYKVQFNYSSPELNYLT